MNWLYLLAEDKDPVLEALADLEHARWSKWQAYLYSKCTKNEDGSLTIPAEDVAHWQKQIDTPYAELSEKEKDSDRAEARNTLEVLNNK